MRRFPLLVALAALFALFAAPARAVDIPGVLYYSGNGHYYKHYTTATSRASAKAAAEAAGGYLAVITSQAENDWVKANVATTGTPWLGGSDEAVEGTWAWVTGESWSWTNWGPGEPNNSGNEDFLQFRTDGMWNDVPDTIAYTYVVEWNSDPNGPPEVPTNLTATAVSDVRVNLAWNDPSSRETGFEIERAVGGGAFAAFATVAANTVTHADTSVGAETSYSYRVRSVGSGGNSAWSNIATVTTAPPPAVSLTATLVTGTSVRLNWTNVATTATAIEIDRGTGMPGTGFSLLGSTSGTATTYLDTQAQPESTLAYRIRSVGSGGAKSGWSPEAYVVTPPASPSGLSLTAASDTSVVLGWDDNSTIETGYEIERGEGVSPASFTSIVVLPVDYRAYTDDTAQPETTYTYRVRARNDSGNSDWSASGRITTPPRTPENAAANSLSASRMRVSWSDVSVRELGFKIERAVGEEGVFEHLAAVGRGVTEYVDATAHQEVLYRYRVAAYSADGLSKWSDAAPTRMPAVLVLGRLSVTPAKKKKPATILVTGEFDVGGRGVDLKQPCTISVGGSVVSFPAGVARGKAVRAQADGARLDLKPAVTSSRVPFQLTATADLFPIADPGGEIKVEYVNGEFSAAGTVYLDGGSYLPPLHGSLGDPACALLSLSATMSPSGGDGFVVKAAFDTSGGLPANAPIVVVRCGAASYAADISLFQRSGSKFTLTQKVDGGTRAVTLDYLAGVATVTVRGGVEIGTVAKGSVPLDVSITIGSLSYADTVTVKSTGRAAKY